MPFSFGPMELIIIFMIIVVFFGAKRLPELARSLGRSIKEFKHATDELKEEFDVNKIDSQKKSAQQPVPPAQENPEPIKNTPTSKNKDTTH